MSILIFCAGMPVNKAAGKYNSSGFDAAIQEELRSAADFTAGKKLYQYMNFRKSKFSQITKIEDIREIYDNLLNGEVSDFGEQDADISPVAVLRFTVFSLVGPVCGSYVFVVLEETLSKLPGAKQFGIVARGTRTVRALE